MQTNKLTERLTIQNIKYSGDTMGNSVPYYTNEKTLFASITNQRNSNTYDEGNYNTDRISFYLRYTPFFQAKKHVVRYNGCTYTIDNVTHIRRTQATVIDCIKVD